MTFLGEKIRILRKQYRLTLKQLAQKSNISSSYLCDIEKGRSNPSLETLENIAAALKVSPSSLLYGDAPLIAEDTGTVNVVKVPLLKEVSLDQPLLEPQNIERWFVISLDDSASVDKLIFFQVNDDTMIGNRLLQGDLVLVKLGAGVRQGDLVLVGLKNKKACIRRVSYRQKKQIVLDAGHPVVKPLVVKENENARILGKVIQAIIKFE